MAGAGGARRLPAADLPHLRPGRSGLVAQRHRRPQRAMRAAASAPGSPMCCSTCSACPPTGGSCCAWWRWSGAYRAAATRSGARSTGGRSPSRLAASSLLLRVERGARGAAPAHARAQLPLAPGGMLGSGDRRVRRRGLLGFTGATLLLLALRPSASACSPACPGWRSRSSPGGCVEAAARIVRAAPGSSAPTARRGRSRARSARSWSRTEKKREEDHPPLRDRAAGGGDQAHRERVQKEKQAPLFEDLPDTPLPPLQAARRGRARRRAA